MSTPLQALSEENRPAFNKARAEAYAAATTTLRGTYREEYNKLVQAEMAERGFDWAPRPTGRDRALEQIRAMAAKAGLGVDEVAAALMPGDVPGTSQ